MLTIGWPAAKVERFDRFRKKRNMIGYETAGVVSEQEAREMHELAVDASCIIYRYAIQ